MEPKKFIAEYGTTALARKVGVSKQVVNAWKTRNRIPELHILKNKRVFATLKPIPK